MVKQDKLPFRLSFRCDDVTLEGLEELSIKLRTGQSEVLRIAVKRLMESYLNIKSDVIILEKDKWDQIVGKLIQRIGDEPKRTEKAIKEAMDKVSIELTKKLKQEGVLK